MQVVTADLVKDKKVLLRLDIDVPLGESADQRISNSDKQSLRSDDLKLVVLDDFRLVAGMPTLELCLKHAQKVIILGHIGRPARHRCLARQCQSWQAGAQALAGGPNGKKVEELSVAPVYDWLVDHGFGDEFDSGKLKLLENLRFEKGEEEESVYFAKELAVLGNFYVNEAFASHHKAASTTVLPMLLPHAAGLQFEREVKTLTKIREAPRPGLVAIIGGIKVEDKLPAVLSMAKIADKVLVGGRIAGELLASSYEPIVNVLVADLTEDSEDITAETVEKWAPIISSAKMIVWNGPLGKVEDHKNNKSEKVAQLILESGAETIVGGGDTVGFLGKIGLLDEFEQKGFVSTGGGAMLKFLETGTLPTIEALLGR